MAIGWLSEKLEKHKEELTAAKQLIDGVPHTTTTKRTHVPWVLQFYLTNSTLARCVMYLTYNNYYIKHVYYLGAVSIALPASTQCPSIPPWGPNWLDRKTHTPHGQGGPAGLLRASRVQSPASQCVC